MDGNYEAVGGEGSLTSPSEEYDELFLWKIGAQLDFEKCQILGRKLDINEVKLSNICAKVLRGNCSQEEGNFEMLHTWMANQTPDDNPVPKLQDILVEDLKLFSRDGVRRIFKRENLLHESTIERSLGELQLYQISEQVNKGQYIPFILRLSMTFNELQVSKQNYGGDAVMSLFVLLCRWQKALSPKIDQVQSMCNILEACGQRMLAYNIKQNMCCVTYRNGKKYMQCGPNDSVKPTESLSDDDLNIEASATSKMQTVLKFTTEISEKRPGQLDWTGDDRSIIPSINQTDRKR